MDDTYGLFFVQKVGSIHPFFHETEQSETPHNSATRCPWSLCWVEANEEVCTCVAKHEVYHMSVILLHAGQMFVCHILYELEWMVW